jgi:hypothetical protein
MELANYIDIFGDFWQMEIPVTVSVKYYARPVYGEWEPG